MKRYLVPALLGVVLTGASAAAQQTKRTSVEVTPYAGYMVFGKHLEGPFGTSISNANGALYGAQLGIPIASGVSIVGNVGYASSDVEVGVPFLGGIKVGSSDVWLYDGGLQLKLPMPNATVVSPFVQAGAGAAHYSVENSLLGTKATNVAYNVGGGLDLQLSPNLGVRLMAKDYIGKFDFKEATQIDVSNDWSHNIALSVGLKLAF